MKFSTISLLCILLSWTDFVSTAPVTREKGGSYYATRYNAQRGDMLVFDKSKRSSLTPLRMDFNVEKNDPKRRPKTHGRFHKHLSNQASEVILQIENEYSLYVSSIGVGSPEQKLKVQLDTGSSDLWVPAYETTDEYTTFSRNESSTFKKVKDNFKIGYADGTTATGIWAEDTLAFGDVVVKEMQFGYASEQTAGQGVLGIGLKENEASTWLKDSFTYENFPYKLKKDGLISKAAYSLYLNSLHAKGGSVLFGAVDTAKYEGHIQMFPILKIDENGHESESETAFYITLDGITSGNQTFSKDVGSRAALLDSGTTLVYAPNHVANAVGHKYGKYNRAAGGYVTDCDIKGEPLNFHFGNTTVSVPFENILYDLSKDSPIFTNNDCLIGITNSGSDSYILGDGFLRSAYVVYDLEAKKVGVAQAKYTNETNIQSL